MKHFALVIAAVAVLPLTLHAEPSSGVPAAAKVVLSSPYTTTLGDMLGLTMAQYLPVVRGIDPGIDGPVVFSYDHATGKIVVSVYGDPNHTSGILRPIERAKNALEYFRKKYFASLANTVSQTHHVSIDESDLTLIYFDWAHDAREVVRWEGGEYEVKE